MATRGERPCRPMDGPPDSLTAAASDSRLGVANRPAMGRILPSRFLIRAISRAASREWPPLAVSLVFLKDTIIGGTGNHAYVRPSACLQVPGEEAWTLLRRPANPGPRHRLDDDDHQHRQLCATGRG